MDKLPPLQPVAVIRDNEAYKVPRHPAPMDLFLDGNEGQSPPEAFLQELDEIDVGMLASYPHADSLERALANFWDVKPEQVLVTAGADDGIDRICRAMLSEGREALMPWPTFVMLERYASVAGGKVVKVQWKPGLPFPVDQLIDATGPQTGVVMVVSPNNPTGASVSFEDVKKISDLVPQAILLLDGAYAEFSEDDLVARALTLPNVAITRTFSKAWGLAGLRVGYVLSSPQIIKWLRVAGEPYAVSSLSIQLAQRRLLTGQQHVRDFVDRVREKRACLVEELASVGVQVVPSQSNFLLAQVGDSMWWRDAFAGLGIAIRAFPGHPELDGWVRITCPGDDESFERLVRAIRCLKRPEAMLFDLDGVLADVSGSYRQAIVATVEDFGGSLTLDEIGAWKAAGNANNDWILSQKILRSQGIERSLQEVTRRFEQLYQGTDETPGLRLTERLLWSRAELEALRTRWPLAIVTGRPLADAMTFLKRFEIDGLFSAIVTMEDGPSKPDPTVVRVAMERLGVRSGWMFGDTPDDVKAARGCGVLPVGVVPPTEDPERSSEILRSSGAARVLRSLSALEALLP